MTSREQNSSSIGIAVVAAVIALGVLCLLGLLFVGGLLFFGIQASPSPPPVLQAAPPLTQPAQVVPSGRPPQYYPATSPTPFFIAQCDEQGRITVDGEELSLELLIEQLNEDGLIRSVTVYIHPRCEFARALEIQTKIGGAGHNVTAQLASEPPKEDKTETPSTD